MAMARHLACREAAEMNGKCAGKAWSYSNFPFHLYSQPSKYNTHHCQCGYYVCWQYVFLFNRAPRALENRWRRWRQRDIGSDSVRLRRLSAIAKGRPFSACVLYSRVYAFPAFSLRSIFFRCHLPSFSPLFGQHTLTGVVLCCHRARTHPH